MMWVKVPPTRLRYESLPAHTDQARFLEGEALNRAQPDGCYGLTLALMGSSYGETEPEKATQTKAEHNIKPPTSLEPIPATQSRSSGLSPGNPVVELATPNGTINLTEGTKKNELRVKGKVEPPCKLDEKRNSPNSGRTDRNWSEVFRVNALGVEYD